jgi:hypothetical protein
MRRNTMAETTLTLTEEQARTLKLLLFWITQQDGNAEWSKDRETLQEIHTLLGGEDFTIKWEIGTEAGE